MNKKVLGLVATTALTGGLMLSSISPASAAHYCKTTPSGVHQTNGNGARGGSDGWLNSSVNNKSGQGGIENAEEAGALEDCGAGNPPPAPNSNKP